ncbi:hypothetical protein BH11PSE10_BH11PSE10_05280 [soil metagenome]
MRAMSSYRDVRAGMGRLPRRVAVLMLAALVALLLLGAMVLLLQPRESGGFGPAALLATAMGTAAILLLVAAIGWHVGVRLTRQRLGEALREARAHAHVLTQLQTDWQWASDAEHHLVRWQAPQGAPSSAWVGNGAAVAATATLWQRFELEPAGDSATPELQAAFAAQANFSDIVVCAREAPFKRWRLRGVACWDGAGHFVGFQGTAQALPAAPAAATKPAPVAAWLDALPGPAWLLSEATPTLPSTVLAVNAAAAAAGIQLAVGDAWDDTGVGQPDTSLSLRAFGDAGGRQLVALLQPRSEAAAQAKGELQAAAFEHASFSYTVSHDLRAPLRVVEGFARILKEDYGRLLDRIGNDHLDRVMGAAARMNSMIDALLSLSQLSTQPLAYQPVNLSQLAGFVVEELRRGAPERAVEVQIQPALQVQGDPTLLRMVLENLLGNAWKYCGKRALGQIRLEAMQDPENGGQWVYCIADNGAGFDMRFADRLFGVFQRLHSASDFQGTGVGLASVRRIVRRHGGEIWAESEVGDGARFYFTLASNSTASSSRSA